MNWSPNACARRFPNTGKAVTHPSPRTRAIRVARSKRYSNRRCRNPVVPMPVVVRSVTPPSNCVKNNRSEEHTSELQSLMRISYAVFCLKKQKQKAFVVEIALDPYKLADKLVIVHC